jgi:two-component system sensor histidine kinase MprB
VTLRSRLTLVATAAVAVAVALAAGASFLLVRGQLNHEVDRGLRRTATEAAQIPFLESQVVLGGPVPAIPSTLRVTAVYTQLVGDDGSVVRPAGTVAELPVNARDQQIAAGTAKMALRDVTVDRVHVRMVTVPVRTGLALQVGRPLEDQDRVLRRLGVILAIVALGGIAIAAALGRIVARATLSPVEHLTAAAEHVASTQDLSATIDVPDDGELGRLAASFNAMLNALDESRKQQRQLVADASHELRTPLTSLRTNIEVLALTGLSAGDRTQLIRDVSAQLEELTMLVGDLVELAREEAPPEEELVDVRLDEVVTRAVERVRRRQPGLVVTTDLQPWVVTGSGAMLERAVTNLLDNAVKWSPVGGTVTVRLRHGEVEVRDEGAGIEPADIPFVFDRFYRASGARSMPGSGLGLAIVRQAATAHGGTVRAGSRSDGLPGAAVSLTVPGVPAVVPTGAQVD